MLFDIEVWLIVVLLALPPVVLVVATIRTRRFHQSANISTVQRKLYWAALGLTLTNAVTYVCYWSWRFFALYDIGPSFQSALWLERFMYASPLIAAGSIVCLFTGRGPYRLVIALCVIWMATDLWLHPHIIHWA